MDCRTTRTLLNDFAPPDEPRESEKNAVGACVSSGSTMLSRIRCPLNSDEELVYKLRAGETEALTVLFERYSSLVFRIARRILRDDAEAEDTVQQVFLDLFRSVAKFDPAKGTFKVWLLMYAYHRALNHKRRLQSARFYELEDLEEVLQNHTVVEKKRPFPFEATEAAHLVREAGLPLTVNAVVHRHNLDRLDEIIELAVALEADRLEVAHVQYYGWALANRAALLPSRRQLDIATATVEAARGRLAGRLVIDYVVPAKSVHGRLGPAFSQRKPRGQSAPVPRGRGPAGSEFPDRRAGEPLGNLVSRPCLRAVSRDGVDAGAMPLLRAPRDRLGRLPLPIVRADRRRWPHRPRLCTLPRPPTPRRGAQ